MAENNVELVVARQTGNPVEAEVARALLEDAGIPAVVQGAILQDFLGYGRFGSGHNLVAGPVRVLVRREDAAGAAEVLAVMDRPGGADGGTEGEGEQIGEGGADGAAAAEEET